VFLTQAAAANKLEIGLVIQMHMQWQA